MDVVPVVDDSMGGTTWLVDIDGSRALAVDAQAEIVWKARRIGRDRLLGELGGGLTAWQGGVVVGGPDGWARHPGQHLEAGP